MQLRWKSHILKDFVQVFYIISNIFKNPSDPIVKSVFALPVI